MKRESTHRQVTQAVNDGWVAGGAFFGSILSGFLLGYFGDRWLGTEPWLVIVGILAGSYWGFVKLWNYAKEQEAKPRGR